MVSFLLHFSSRITHRVFIWFGSLSLVHPGLSLKYHQLKYTLPQTTQKLLLKELAYFPQLCQWYKHTKPGQNRTSITHLHKWGVDMSTQQHWLQWLHEQVAIEILVQSELCVFLDFASSFFKSSRHLNLKFQLCSKIQNYLKKTGLQCKYSNLQLRTFTILFCWWI